MIEEKESEKGNPDKQTYFKKQGLFSMNSSITAPKSLLFTKKGTLGSSKDGKEPEIKKELCPESPKSKELKRSELHILELKKTKSQKKANEFDLLKLGQNPPSLLDMNREKIIEIKRSLFTDNDKKNIRTDYIISTGNFDTRTLKLPSYLILPNSKYKRCWDVLLCLFLLISLIVIPIDVGWNFECFSDDNGEAVNTLYTITTVFFFLDIFLNFFTVYVDERNQYIFELGSIITHYIRTDFIFDLLGSLPFDKMCVFTTEDCFRSTNNGSKKLMLLTLIRILKLNRYIRLIEDIFAQFAIIIRLVKLFIILLYLSHAIGNLFCGNSPTLFPMLFQPCMIESTIEGWNACARVLMKEKFTSFYFYSVYMGLYLICGNEVYVQEHWEKIIEIFVNIISIGLTASIFGSVAVITSKMTFGLSPILQQKIDVMREYMNFMKIDEEFIGTIEEYHVNVWLKQRNMMYDEKFFAGLSMVLRKRILIDQWKCSFFEISLFLKEISNRFFLDMLPMLTPRIYMKHDIIITEGEKSISGIFLLSKTGLCTVKIGGETVRSLEPGDFFGEISIFLRSKRRTASVICVKNSDFLSLDEAKLEGLLRDFPQDYAKLKEIAKAKLISSIKLYPSSLFAKLVPPNDVKDYFMRKCVYLEAEEEDLLFAPKQSLSLVDMGEYKSRLQYTIALLENLKDNIEKMRKMKRELENQNIDENEEFE